MKRLAIYGTGGFAREVLEVVRDINAVAGTYDVVGWLDDDASRHGLQLKGLPVLGTAESALDRFDVAVVAIGQTHIRRRIAQRLTALAIPSPALVSPRAWFGHDVEIGDGSLITAGVMVTTDVVIGRHVVLNLGVTVGHDAQLADYVTVAPSVNVSGNVTIGEGVDVGTGTSTVQGVRIGPWAVIGAGAAVVRDVPPDTTVVGVPAKVIAQRTRGWHRGDDEPSIADS